MSTIKTGFLIGLGIVAAFFIFQLVQGGMSSIGKKAAPGG